MPIPEKGKKKCGRRNFSRRSDFLCVVACTMRNDQVLMDILKEIPHTGVDQSGQCH